MKVLFRMLASILPGVVVGLGVIAYLEREALQEQWMLYSAGEGHHAAHGQSEFVTQQWNPAVTEPQPIEIPESFNVKLAESVESAPEPALAPVAQSESVIAPLAQVERTVPDLVAPSQTETAATPVAQSPQQPDLAVVVGLEPATVAPAAVEKMKPGLVAPSVPAPVQQEQLNSLMEQQRKVSEVIADQLPALTEQIANLSKPIESLAQQFNPLNGADPMRQNRSAGAEKNIWALEEAAEEESQLQWLWNRGRQAFWEGNYEQAVESYRSLLEEDAKNPDAWGELGNIYYAKKDWVRAVRAFGRAAAALIEVDRVDEAKKIIQVIRTIDPALADQLDADLG